MKLIIPFEILMQENLTWQALAYLILGLSLGATALVYGILCVIGKALKIWKEFKSR